MTDQCKNCIYRGYIEKCEAAECGQHESWYARAMKERARAAIELLREYQNKPKADNNKN